MKDTKIISTAAFLGMTAIILGAFGAHALKKVLNIEQLDTFETGVKYQMYHALLLLFVGMAANISAKMKQYIYWLTVVGVLFFSGSIYLLATNNLTAFDFRTIGFITPIGGFLLIVAWLCIFINFTRRQS